MSAVSLREVVKLFSDGAVTAVNGVSFDVNDGELLVLLGPSGCGKTTTLRMIAGLEEPDGGDLLLGETLVSSADRNIFIAPEKRNVGMVFQSYAIWPHMTVFDNVAYPLRVRKAPKNVIREKVGATLSLLGLEDFARRPAPQLSGGQQQRVALARALVFEPRLLLLDEPLSNLDAKLRVHMRLELKTLQRQTGITSVFVTHDQAESMALADRIIVMNQGHIEQIGTAQEIYERPMSQFVSEFVGTINVLAAEVVTAPDDSSTARLKVDWSEDELVCVPPAGLALKVGQGVLVSIRPERLRLRRDKLNGSANVWKCKVENAVYYGDHREFDVTVGERHLKITAPPEITVEAGETLFLACEPDDVVLMPRDSVL